MNIDADGEYEEYQLKSAEPSNMPGGSAGWSLYLEGGLCIGCPATECKRAPEAGETVRLYGKGFGYPVRGISIGGRCYCYLTTEHWEAEQQAAAASPAPRSPAASVRPPSSA